MRTFQRGKHRNQPAVHHCRRHWPETPASHPEPCKARTAHRRPLRKKQGSVPELPQGRKAHQRRNQRSRHGWRHEPYASGQQDRSRHLRQDPEQERQPRRVRRNGCCNPGRCSSWRGQGRAASGRHSAFTGHRDPGRRLHQADRQEHDHPGQEERNLLDGRRQPALC